MMTDSEAMSASDTTSTTPAVRPNEIAKKTSIATQTISRDVHTSCFVKLKIYSIYDMFIIDKLRDVTIAIIYL